MATPGNVSGAREGMANSKFPYAPPEWSALSAFEVARQEDLTLGDDHWELIRGLQAYFARHEGASIGLRELRDALDEKFHYKGGMAYLYTLLPGGPIAQGCRLAGLKPPSGAIDRSFGSVA